MKTKMSFSRAKTLAEKIKAALSPGCEWIEIAGSIRRQRPSTGDIKLVAIPKQMTDPLAQLSLLGEPPKQISALDVMLDRLVEEKDNFKRGDKNGPNFKNFKLYTKEHAVTGKLSGEIGLDLFLTTPQQWGFILALRTGPSDFCRAMVTPQEKLGLLQDGYRFAGGYLYGPAGEMIPTPSESDVFCYLGEGRLYLGPTDRDNWRKWYDMEGSK